MHMQLQVNDAFERHLQVVCKCLSGYSIKFAVASLLLRLRFMSNSCFYTYLERHNCTWIDGVDRLAILSHAEVT